MVPASAPATKKIKIRKSATINVSRASGYWPRNSKSATAASSLVTAGRLVDGPVVPWSDPLGDPVALLVLGGLARGLRRRALIDDLCDPLGGLHVAPRGLARGLGAPLGEPAGGLRALLGDLGGHPQVAEGDLGGCSQGLLVKGERRAEEARVRAHRTLNDRPVGRRLTLLLAGLLSLGVVPLAPVHLLLLAVFRNVSPSTVSSIQKKARTLAGRSRSIKCCPGSPLPEEALWAARAFYRWAAWLVACTVSVARPGRHGLHALLSGLGPGLHALLVEGHGGVQEVRVHVGGLLDRRLDGRLLTLGLLGEGPGHLLRGLRLLLELLHGTLEDVLGDLHVSLHDGDGLLA